jgi:hypothetical protein
MDFSKLECSEEFAVKFSFYTALLGNPSTGKSTALNLVTNAVYDIEKANNIEEESSRVANGATVEALIELLKQMKSIVSFYDESSSFLGALGRYNGTGSSYDRGIFLELFNMSRKYNRDLKSGRTRLHEPKLNMCLLGHPHIFVKLLSEERNSHDDGLMQRFLICSPEPLLDITIEEMAATPKPASSLVNLLYLIEQVNQVPLTLFLDKEASSI